MNYSKLKTKLSGIDITVLDSCESTNDLAKGRAAVERPFLIVARDQTAGRGSKGRSFACAPDCGVYFSVGAPITEEKLSELLVTPAAALAASFAVETLTPLRTGIKWVNDVCVDEKKLCGVLCEAVHRSYETLLVAGFGINIRRFEALSLVPNACALDDFFVKIDPAELVAETVTRFLAYLRGGEVLREYKKRNFLLGREVSYAQNGAIKTGIAVDIAENGNLAVEADGRIEFLSTADVSLASIRGTYR